MVPESVFPTIMITLSIFAASMYCYLGDWRHTAYWIASAVIIYSVTY